jgi:hypothetical protein
VRTDIDDPPRRTMSSAQLLGCRDTVMSSIAAERTMRRSGRFAVRRRVAAIALVPAAALAIAAAVALQAGPVLNVTCLDADGDGTVVGADGRNPLDICAQLWAEGAVDARVTVVPAALTACASNDGVVVFPDADPSRCDKEGFRPVPDDYQSIATQFVSMRDDLAERWAFGTCVAKRDAVEMVRTILDAHGYADWIVEVSGFGPTRSCADFAFDPGRGRVLVVGIQDPV